MNKSLSEEKKKYEREFCSLLIQRINDAGGSLPFQHLSGLIQQARFEIRNAFGTTKGQLMKFLKAHPKKFQIDSAAGIVTICDSPFSDDDTEDNCTNKEVKLKENLPSNIDKGIGTLLRKRPLYGIINATEPIETKVHFSAEAYFGNKDCLLTDDSSLLEGGEIYFNAVYCYDDNNHCGLQYSAKKVWQKFDERENSNKTSCDRPVSNELNGQGTVKKLNADYGFISNGLENIFFHKTSVKDCHCDDLTLFLKKGERVEFFATKLRKDDKTSKWQAKSVRKISQNAKSSTGANPVKSTLENEPGKIYPNSSDIVIKFGKKFTELADGNSCSYFLYGGEVTDIKYEFSEGDDIFFDAEKTKSASEWKALLVWVGEKPVCYNYKKAFTDNKSEISEDESVSSSVSHSSKSMTQKSKRVEKNQSLSDHSNSRRCGKYNEKFKKQTSKLQNSENFSTKKSRNESERNKNEKDNLFVNRRGKSNNRRGNERKFISKKEHKKSYFTESVAVTHESDEEIHKTASNFEDHRTYKNSYSNSSQGDSDDDNQGSSLSNKYLVTKRADKNCLSAPRHHFSSTSDNDMDNTCNEIKSYNNEDKRMASIKKFDDVEGKIVNLYCKAAIIESSCLENNIDFMLNAFYLNGKSGEEQQVIDLKEVIKVGDAIKFNCFEIIDDEGKSHQKVTMAWKGQKPEVYEMTPEEFISEHDLSVSINEEFQPKPLSGEITCPKNLLAGKYLESTSSESSSKSESEEEVSDDKYSGKSNSDSIEKEDEDGREVNEENTLVINNKPLSQTVLERLKYKGFIPSDLQVNMSGLLTEVTNLVQKHCDRCNGAALSEPRTDNPETFTQPICPSCEITLSEENKSESDVATQTIITGGIVAQSIYTQP